MTGNIKHFTGLFTRLTDALTPWITQGLSVLLTLRLCSHPWLFLCLPREPSVVLYLSFGAKPNGKCMSELNQESTESAEVMPETGRATSWKITPKEQLSVKSWHEISEHSADVFGRVDWCPHWFSKFLIHSSPDLAESSYKVVREPGSMEVTRTFKNFVPHLLMGIWKLRKWFQWRSSQSNRGTTSARAGFHCAWFCLGAECELGFCGPRIQYYANKPSLISNPVSPTGCDFIME